MSSDILKSQIEESSRFLRSENVVSDSEAQLRAGRFLEMQFRLINGIRDLSSDLLKAKTVLHLTTSQLTQTVEGKTVGEREAKMQADPTFISAREQYESLKHEIEYLQGYLDTVRDAHVFYRQLSKGESYVKI